MTNMALEAALGAALNRIAKWRAVFTGWQLGTRPKSDPEAQAVSDAREAQILMRVELNALLALLIDKGVINRDEYTHSILTECEHFEKLLQRKFPGFRAADEGMIMDAQRAAETTKGWRK